ncbi:MAG: NAD-dependent succinate-semialdehyde dehydrogenase [Corynebacterium sp.]|nr:NAD-dependent succinate-semialdehyde dehydrogenase [Corynebacterium sp.]
MTNVEVLNPATGLVIGSVADMSVDTALEFLGAATIAGSAWAETAPRTKATLLYAIFEAVAARTEEIAQIMHEESGKTLEEARGEVAYGNEYFRWFAEEATRIPGRVNQAPAGTGTIVVTRTPVGPVLAITPWNFPLAMATRKIAPALAAGCPILVKPARETPFTMLKLEEIIHEVMRAQGINTDLFRVITSRSSAAISEALMNDPRLRKVTFTGSTAVGKKLVAQSVPGLLRMSMELGGNAPFVIAADADLDVVLPQAMAAKMRNWGQACIAANRFIVEKPIAEAFTQRLLEEFHALEPRPLITDKQRAQVHELVHDAVERGATLLTGGEIPEGPGYFYPATILTDIPADARILREEIFGPVAPIITTNSLDEAINLANDTEFGLASYGFSTNHNTCQRFARELKAGMVGINRGAISDPAAPFGGILQSGFGREGGTEGIEEYLDTKYIALT